MKTRKLRWTQWIWAVALLVLVACSALGSRSSLVWNGHPITVRGGNSHTIVSEPDRVEIGVDAHLIVVTATQIEIDGASEALPAFEEMDIEVGRDAITVRADDEPIWP